MNGISGEARLTIHIGMPKTATTSIQRALFKNSELLLSQGIDYCPELCGIGMFDNAAAHHAIATYLCNPSAWNYQQIDETLIERAFRKPGELLISSEGFSIANEKQINLLTHKWKAPESRRVVIVVRDEFSYIKSLWMQAIKTGHHLLTFKQFYLNYKKSRKPISTRLGPWRNCGYEIKALRYESLISKEQDVALAFVSALYNISLEDNWLLTKRANVSPSFACVDNYRSVMDLLLPQSAKQYFCNNLHPHKRIKIHDFYCGIGLLNKWQSYFSKSDDLAFVKQDLSALPSIYDIDLEY
ncbi:hypothetical protein FLM48_14035 [Shewanella sp. Scap07]|uniref:hypothetical protein n=1 Tax=Shewanella sp. Scap07 TaxID=2589987 RepID=UPI0015C0F909|nr:hypothetical protein [Shewanella sp. Scap07]QLE86086.1 hypothetical protein FLM48_14035 [Shewanella sp. Scap07]